jgi:sulfur-carrier protein
MTPTESQIRVQLPYHLRTLAHIEGELTLNVAPPLTIASVLDALEDRYPMLAGTIREHDTHKRRPFLRFFACQEDLSLQPPDTPLPAPVLEGREPFLIIGAISGG